MLLQMNPVNWFEIPVNDLERAKEFYEFIFDIEMTLHELEGSHMAWFPMEPDKGGATGTLLKADTHVPSHSGTLVYLSVGDINTVLAKISQKGGKIITPKTSIGEHGFFAYFEDCEGNRLALHSEQ